ncbi:MAG: formylglycine-generating enzyme family protein [Chloroflexaceae bacterium]|nr:formylglycine-generating enzyme family protein [Chloroflexaceae bacterium]
MFNSRKRRFFPVSLLLLGIIGLLLLLPAIALLAQPGERPRCETGGDFVWIPAGAFMQGSDRRERDYAYRISAEAEAKHPAAIAPIEERLRQQQWFERESARSQQSLDGLCISRHLVTNAEYQAFVRATGWRSPGISPKDYQRQGFLVHPYGEVRAYLWENDGFPAGEGQHPVVLVSYDDAIAYAHWQGRQDGQTYALPTAAQWEKAARGTDGRYFPWGNDWRDKATNWSGSGRWHTSEIGAYPLSRSLYGVEDMAGNVFEFTATRRSPNESVMKGCSWDDLPGFCRAAYQHTRPPASRHILFGFRLVKLYKNSTF